VVRGDREVLAVVISTSAAVGRLWCRSGTGGPGHEPVACHGDGAANQLAGCNCHPYGCAHGNAHSYGNAHIHPNPHANAEPNALARLKFDRL
jgi:hypothetical protein